MTVRAASIALLALAACGRERTPSGETPAIDADHVTVVNATANRLFYSVFPEPLLTRIEWVPCADPGACAGQTALAPGDSTVLSYAPLLSSGVDSGAVLAWWQLEPDGKGGYRVGYLAHLPFRRSASRLVLER